MRKFLKKLTNISKFQLILATLFVAFAVVLVPSVSDAWGPARATFTMEHPAKYVTFNSITDNPSYGDEQNFLSVKESTASNSSYTDTISVKPGKQYTVMVFYHNNASATYNADGSGIAHGAFARVEIPAIVSKDNKPVGAESYVGASNANPQQVYDEVFFKNGTGNDIALRYVPGSTVIHSKGAVNNKVMPDTILSSSGVKLGYDSLNGDLPGCNEYAGYITFNVQADQPALSFKKQVRLHQDGNYKDGWASNITAEPGKVVDYRLEYKNIGTVEQHNVVFKDVLPKGLNYVKGSSVLIDGASPTGKKLTDEISRGGMNVGSYAPGAASYLVFSAKVGNVPCTNLVNKADVETDNGALNGQANVSTGSDCALPVTGPAQVVAGLVGVAAITIGAVYYFISRRDLSAALTDSKMHNLTGHVSHTHKK